jgi:transposase, IS6 family
MEIPLPRCRLSGDTIEFMLSARRDVSAAKRFFKKLMRADHRRLPFTIGTDKHASYPEAFATSVNERVLPPACKLRRVKYLNNVIEQDHRAVRRR